MNSKMLSLLYPNQARNIVTIEQLTKEVEVCDLFRKCFGKEAYHLVQMYLSLNQDGKEEAFKRIMELTQLEQYSIKRDSKLTG